MRKKISLQESIERINKTEAEINMLIKNDLLRANCNEINIDSWMELFSTNERMQEKYLKLCSLEMSLIDAQLVAEHQKV